MASGQTVAAGAIPIRGSGRLALADSAVGPGRAQARSVPRHDYPLVPLHSAAALSLAALYQALQRAQPMAAEDPTSKPVARRGAPVPSVLEMGPLVLRWGDRQPLRFAP